MKREREVVREGQRDKESERGVEGGKGERRREVVRQDNAVRRPSKSCSDSSG